MLKRLRGCLDRLGAILVDLDGVVWIGSRPLEDNLRALKRLMERGVEILFLTNNSTRSRESYAEAIRRLGVEASRETVITSGFLASEWLRLREGRVEVYAIGEEGLIEELILAGHRILTLGDHQRARALVVGLDRNLNYAKLRAAVRTLLGGALFIATNTDHLIPVEDGLDPGAGAIIAALEKASGRKVDYVAGKPNPWIVEYIINRYRVPREELVVVGDRLDTDMRLAIDSGVRGILVLTGFTGEEEIKNMEAMGNRYEGEIYIAKTLMDLVEGC
ncbi:MAG: HAD-IIA family hydrolase [Desulfurococcales archaeon]|jgi:4-nitrophenyl phosphatase|nr:HAD-IIA family hydrolase [Desulfurococcales archaeon]